MHLVGLAPCLIDKIPCDRDSLPRSLLLWSDILLWCWQAGFH